MDFNTDTDIPLLTGKVILVTGGTDGLGKESVRQFCQHSPAHIYLAGRNRSKAERVLTELDQAYPNHAPIILLDMDLASLASVRSAAQTFLASNSRLDILMCNAGLAGAPNLTKDGYERMFGVNHLGHALLIQLLLPTLRATATTTTNPNADVRVVTLSSMGEKFAPKHYTFDKMRTDLAQLGLMTRYGQSKLANIHYTSILAKKDPEITFVSVHPGQVSSNFASSFFEGRAWVEALLRPLAKALMHVADVREGVRGQIWCAVAKKTDLVNGDFYWPVGVREKGSARSKDLVMAGRLWEWTDEQLKVWL